ncbi:hypothetical protein THAOC_24943, partial [Thalassiosira oceanica]
MDPKLVGLFFSHSSLTLVADPLVESAVTSVSVPMTPRVRKPLSITTPPSVTSTTATLVVPAPISADDIGDVPSPPTDLGHHSPEGVGEVEDRVPEGAVGSTVDPSAVASTKAAVDICSRRASTAPAIDSFQRELARRNMVQLEAPCLLGTPYAVSSMGICRG